MKILLMTGAGFLMLTSFAFAAVNMNVGAGAEVQTTMMPVEMEMKADMKMGATATSTPPMMNDEEHEEGMERAEMMADENAEFGLENAKVHINVRALMKEESEPGHGAGEAEVDDAAKVHSAVDFEHFVAHKANDDENIKDVEVKEGKVKVGYRMPAKFLGFMGGSLRVRAEADAAGNVEVKYPWYHIFMKKHVSSASLQADIARALAAKRKAVKEGVPAAEIEADVEAAFDAPNLFEIIADVLHGASMSAGAQAQSETTAEVTP